MTNNADNTNVLARIATVVNKQNNFGICMPSNASQDAVAASLVLYVALTKLGKNVSIACATALSGKYNLPGIDKIQRNLSTGGDNLVVSFPYTDGAIDKVTYNIEGNTFNLLIIPREGQAKLDPSQVKYSHSGGKVDAIFTLDTPNLNSLGALFSSNQDQFSGREIINIDRHLTNAKYGTINLVEKSVSSISEIILQLLTTLNAEIDRDMATNLYSGISAATNNFTSYSVNAQTFEAGAYLMKLGAVKRVPTKQTPTGQVGSTSFNPQSQYQPRAQPMPQAPAQYRPTQQSISQPQSSFPQTQGFSSSMQASRGMQSQSAAAQPTQMPVSQQSLPKPVSQQPVQRPIPQQVSQPIPQPASQPANPPLTKESHTINQEYVERREVKSGEGNGVERKRTPKEWLKPKIFKGSNLV